MEDGLFPSFMSIGSGEDEIEEERRLCYVAITRAMDNLIITSARQRMHNGESRYSVISRFINEIPKELISSNVSRPRAFSSAGIPGEKKSAIPVKAFSTTQTQFSSKEKVNLIMLLVIR